MDPKEIKEVVLGVTPMTLEAFIAIARYGATVTFDQAYRQRTRRSRGLVEKFLNEERIIYGMTTGFGSNVKNIIAPGDAVTLQKNIIRSHAVSVGEPLEKEVVRGIHVMMLQSMGQGYSGTQPETLELIKDLLNHDVTPYAPGHGSVGYLAVEAHMSLVLIGEGKAWFKDTLMSGAEALKAAGLQPIELGCKEGLALVSGVTSPTALATLAVYDALKIVKTADIAAAMTLEALKGTLKAFDPRLHAVKRHEDQAATARNIQKILADSEIAEKHEHYRLQDALSLRCIPHLHGAAKKTLKDAAVAIEDELNSCGDNPIIYPDGEDGLAMSGCNCDSSYVGIESDSICIALTNLAKISERRIDRLVNHLVSELPAFLIKNAGLNSGYMIPQYTAVGLLNEMRSLATSCTIDGVPTCANQEDHVAMGYNAAKSAYQSAKHLEYILAIEILSNLQALDFLAPLKPGTASGAVYTTIRREVPFLENDRYIYPDIEFVHKLVREGEIIRIVENAIGKLEL